MIFIKKLIILLGLTLLLFGCSDQTKNVQTTSNQIQIPEATIEVKATNTPVPTATPAPDWVSKIYTIGGVTDDHCLDLENIYLDKMKESEFDLSLLFNECGTLGGRSQTDDLHMYWNNDKTKAFGVFLAEHDGYFSEKMRNDESGELIYRLELMPENKKTIIKIISQLGNKEHLWDQWVLDKK